MHFSGGILMAEVCKFLRSEHIDAIIKEGKLRFSTLSHFRTLEGEKWIGDPNEATTTVNPKGTEFTSNSIEPVGEPWRPSGYAPVFLASTGGKLRFNADVSINYGLPDVFIFCASDGELEPLTQAMCRDAKDPYDACIKLKTAMWSLAHRAFHRGRIVELGDKKVSELFSRIETRAVTYDRQVHVPSSGPAPVPSPFQKDPEFATQSESRIVLVPRQPIDHSTITIKLPRPDKLFEEVFRSIPPLPAS
jgi:hypothetical protein